MNFGVSVVVFLLETIAKVLAWALGLNKDPFQEPSKNLQENIKSETVATTDEGLEEEIENEEEHQGEHDFKPNEEKEVAENIKHEVIEAIQDEEQKSNPEVVVTNPVLESEKSLDIESMFSQMSLSSSQTEVIDEETTPDKQAEEQLVTPESKIRNKDEENSLFKKMRQQRDKIEGDRSPLLEHPPNQVQDVTPENKKISTPEEESTLLKKLKQQRDKIDTIDATDGPNQIDLKINMFKQAASQDVEDALAIKLKQQLKKIDDNIKVEEVKTKHETKSLVEDALEEKLKKQQLKIDGFYEAVDESTYHHEAQSLVEDALAEKLRKRRNKIDEGVKEIDATFSESLNQKSSTTSWEKEGTLDRKLRKQRQKMKEAEMTDGVEKQIKDAMQDVDTEVKFKDTDDVHSSMSSLVEHAPQVTRTRE